MYILFTGQLLSFRRTVRKKRSSKKEDDKKKTLPNISEENCKDQDISATSLPVPVPTRKHSDPIPTSKQWMSPPMKNSHMTESGESYKPPVSPKPQKKSSDTPYTPPRPRQSQINRAWGERVDRKVLPLKEDQMEAEKKKQRSYSPSRLFGRGSPSPRSSPLSSSPRGSPVIGRRDESLSPPLADIYKSHRSESEPFSKGASPKGASPKEPTGGANPFTQGMVDSMLKYIMASDDPTLKAALCDMVRTDPQLMEELRK